MTGRLLLLAICVTLLGGCGILSPEDAPGDSSSGVIMPLKVGNTWIGKSTEYDKQGAVLSVTFDTLTIESEVRRDGERWFRGSDGALYINRADGLHQEPSDGICACLVAKYPARLNDTFSTESSLVLLPQSGQPVTIAVAGTVIARDTTIAVPAGRYPVLGYQTMLYPHGNYTLVNRGSRDYYSPNVGPVFRQWVDGSRRWELVSMSLQ